MLSYDLPKELIAQRPCEPRDAARLLVLRRKASAISHHTFRDLPEFLQSNDCLILNDTRVIPARLRGRRADTGGKVELLLLERAGLIWRCLAQPGRRIRPGTRLLLDHGSEEAKVVGEDGPQRLIRFMGASAETLLERFGEVPLPPYIHRPVEPQDRGWYQTVYARHPGAVAAPTAGLHFTPQLLSRIKRMGVRIHFLTLHVGWGTFKPVSNGDLESGRLHPERFHIPVETIRGIAATRRNGGRVVAVGTTVVRALESWAKTQGGLTPKGSLGSDPTWSLTELFIRPGFEFKEVDALVTNFHLPGTSLLLLVAAFAGEERMRCAYEEAVRQRYRFYSYGDAMLIV